MKADEQRAADELEQFLTQSATPDGALDPKDARLAGALVQLAPHIRLDARFAAQLEARLRRAYATSHERRELAPTRFKVPRWRLRVEGAPLIAAAAVLLLALISFAMFRAVGSWPLANAPTATASPDKRSLAIGNIRTCLNTPSASVQYLSTARSAYAYDVMADWYRAGSYDVAVNSATGRVIQIQPSAVAAMTEQGTRLSAEQLRALALQFIARCAGADLVGLVENGGTKGDNSFFRWEDRTRTLDGMYPFVQVGLSPTGELLSYSNSLELASRAAVTSTPATPIPTPTQQQSGYLYNLEFPLNVGNSWVYRVTRYEGPNESNIMTATFTLTDTVVSVETKNGFYVANIQSEHSAESLVSVRGSYPVTDSLQPAHSETYWLIAEGNRIIRQDRLNLADLPAGGAIVELAFAMQLSSRWSMYYPPGAPVNRQVTTQGALTVPAGTFANCFYLQGQIGSMTFDDWFCPAVGFVMRTADHHGTPYGTTSELIHYTANR